MSTPIGTLGTIPTLQIGGRVYTDLTNLKTLFAYAGAGTWGTMRAPNGTAGYQVTGGTTLLITSYKENISVSADRNGTVGYGDTDVGFNAGGAPTTPIYYAAGSTSLQIIGSSNAGPAERTPTSHLNFSVPAGKYPFIYSTTGSIMLMAYGYES